MNPRPLHCERSALPTELPPRHQSRAEYNRKWLFGKSLRTVSSMKLFIKGKFTRISGPIGALLATCDSAILVLIPNSHAKKFAPSRSNQAGNRSANRGGVECWSAATKHCLVDGLRLHKVAPADFPEYRSLQSSRSQPFQHPVNRSSRTDF